VDHGRARRVVLIAVTVCAALYAALFLGLLFGQRQILFRQDAADVDPATLGLEAATVRLKTEDGESLVAWSIAGMGVLAIEYRGYGASTGRPNERGLKLDGEATYAAAIASGAKPERIVVMGESLGSGVAVSIAARHKVGALVLDSPYSSIADVAAAAYWFVPVRALLRDPFRNDLLIAQVNAPTLMVHGTKDPVVPIRFGEKLFALADPPKTFWRVEGAGHLALGERLADVLDWIDRTIG